MKPRVEKENKRGIVCSMDQVINEKTAEVSLPETFQDWFEWRGWTPRRHQLELFAEAKAGRSTLLIAPTGGGKTLAGFLPTLCDLAVRGMKKPGGPGTGVGRGLHTLYISPLKALAVDIARNLEAPVSEMQLPITMETRTGDTPPARRQRQRHTPPDILMTTPEQIALLLSHKSAPVYFGGLKYIVLDELHSLVTSKRGDLLALCLARIASLAPRAVKIGLSATVAEPDDLRGFLVPQLTDQIDLSALVRGDGAAIPEISVLESEAHIPWSGHSARHAYGEIYNAIQASKTVLIFVNTRSQAEMIFQELWKINDDSLPIALHHGSLAKEQRRKVEAAMTRGDLRAVVCTSTLDLGIDWGDVDLVVNVGAPKGASRLLQRIGRANHRLDEASRAVLVPANRFEVLECVAAQDAAIRGELDGPPPRTGGLDVLAQHVLGMACSKPFDAAALFNEVTSALPYKELDWEAFERVLDLVATGGYALRRYDQYRRIVKNEEGRFRVAHPQVAQRYRLNIGTIIEEPLIRVRLVKHRPKKDGKPGGTPMRGGRYLGEVEEFFINGLAPGDTFLFAGTVLKFEGLSETEAYVTRSFDEDPMIPSFYGGKFPLSTYLAEKVREMLATPETWKALPPQVSEWLGIQTWRSVLPRADQLLVETFPRSDKHYLVCYPFDGRLAHQSLGMLLTRRLDRMGVHPLGFVASEYALAIWGLEDMSKLDLDVLFDEDMLGDDMEAWLSQSSLMKRTFRDCAMIAGLIDRRMPGEEKTGRQVTVSSDLLYNVLHEHEPDHILLEATWNDAASGHLDIARLGGLLKRAKGSLVHQPLARVSPLAVPVLLEIGKVPVYGEASEFLLREAADDLIEEATRLV
jgi:ATP-dependent helicase Lhr and Lhr-like helicase